MVTRNGDVCLTHQMIFGLTMAEMAGVGNVIGSFAWGGDDTSDGVAHARSAGPCLFQRYEVRIP